MRARLLVVLAPLVAVSLLFLVGEGYRLRDLAPCTPATMMPAAETRARLLCPADAAPGTSYPACIAALPPLDPATGRFAQPFAPELRARALWQIVFALSTIAGLGLIAYCSLLFRSVYGHRRCPRPAMARAALAAAHVAGGAWAIGVWLPHPQTCFTMSSTLRFVPAAWPFTGLSAWQVVEVQLVFSCLLLVAACIAYVGALYAVTRPPDDPATAIATLQMRISRFKVVTLAAPAALTFAFLTLFVMLDWPRALAPGSVILSEAARTVTAIMGGYMTATLIGAYVPAASLLESAARAEIAARVTDGDPLDRMIRIREKIDKSGLALGVGERVTATLTALLPFLSGALPSVGDAAKLIG